MRVLDSNLQALIDTGHREDHTALVLTLGNGRTVRFATADIAIGIDEFQPELAENDVLKISFDLASNGQTLKVQNVDRVFGRQLAGATELLEGASAVLGMIFRRNPDTGDVWFDPKMPGDVLAGQIDENAVELKFVADLNAGSISGVPIASIFPYSNPATAITGIGPGGGGPPGGGGGGPCFSGNVPVHAAEGVRTFDEIKVMPEDSLRIRNRTGIHRAKLLIHSFEGVMIDMESELEAGDWRLEAGCLVTLDHLFEYEFDKWRRAEVEFPENRRVEFKGSVFNLEILSDDPSDHHYIIVVNGEERKVHNIKPFVI
jgi:hypothetical protein